MRIPNDHIDDAFLAYQLEKTANERAKRMAAIREQTENLEAENERLKVENAALREDRERLEFLISTLNEMDLFGHWCDLWSMTPSPSEGRATDARWRKTIDEVRKDK